MVSLISRNHITKERKEKKGKQQQQGKGQHVCNPSAGEAEQRDP